MTEYTDERESSEHRLKQYKESREQIDIGIE